MKGSRILLLCSGLASCVQSAPAPQLLSLLPVLVDSGHHAARAEASPKGTGPLLIDVASFARQFLGRTEERDADSIAVVLSRPFVRISQSQVTSCTGNSCGVIDDGVHLQLDSLHRTRAGYRAYLTTRVTLNRGLGSSGPFESCPIQWSLDASAVDGTWRVTRKQALVHC